MYYYSRYSHLNVIVKLSDKSVYKPLKLLLLTRLQKYNLLGKNDQGVTGPSWSTQKLYLIPFLCNKTSCVIFIRPYCIV